MTHLRPIKITLAIIAITALLAIGIVFFSTQWTAKPEPQSNQPSANISNNPPPPGPLLPPPPPAKTPEPTSEELLSKSIINTDVPFTVQAPLGQWKDPLQQDACEEASIMMATKWARSEKIGTPSETKDEILKIADWQKEKYGESRDTSTKDTTQRIAKEYYKFDQAEYRENITSDDIIGEFHKGNLVITPMNGQALNNPYFTQPGPERHMILIIGYDAETDEFVTNDPGISKGKNYRYPVAVFFNAIRDYQTGYHLPITREKKNMIIITKNPSSN